MKKWAPKACKSIVKTTKTSDYSNSTVSDLIFDSSQGAQFEVGIVRQFTFSPNLKRMSVITRTLGKSGMEIYCKGAAEMIAQLCVKSTGIVLYPKKCRKKLILFFLRSFSRQVTNDKDNKWGLPR